MFNNDYPPQMLKMAISTRRWLHERFLWLGIWDARVSSVSSICKFRDLENSTCPGEWIIYTDSFNYTSPDAKYHWWGALFIFAKAQTNRKSTHFNPENSPNPYLETTLCTGWFETLYQQSGQKIADSFAALHHSFQLALSDTSKPVIYIVVDALARQLRSPLI